MRAVDSISRLRAELATGESPTIRDELRGRSMTVIETDRHDDHALRVRIELLGIQPTVYRQVTVPASITLPKLHHRL